jgi:hypothetical protein
MLPDTTVKASGWCLAPMELLWVTEGAPMRATVLMLLEEVLAANVMLKVVPYSTMLGLLLSVKAGRGPRM